MLCTPLQSRIVFNHALQNQYAILAINADSHAAVVDCLVAASLVDAPVIIETSLWQLKGRSFGADDAIIGLARYISTLMILANSDRFKNIPVIFHTDHIKGPETIDILTAAICGIKFGGSGQIVSLRASTVSLDASEFTEGENIKHILKLCGIAKEAGVPVTLEMESAVDDRITSAEETKKLLGTVEEEFPDHVHLWAPGVGTRHGFGENMTFTPATIETQRKLTKSVTGREIGIALHGSTGMTSEHLEEAAKAGVVKVNWSTESLLIRSEAARAYYNQHEKFEKKHPSWKNTVMDNGVSTYIAEKYISRVMDRMKTLQGADKAKNLISIL
jgi:fructose/tagatose bisphosphate aldolase